MEPKRRFHGRANGDRVPSLSRRVFYIGKTHRNQAKNYRHGGLPNAQADFPGLHSPGLTPRG
jgi:hypothetical protein